MNPQIELLTITPKQAMEWLGTTNTRNRPERPGVVKSLEAILQRQEWRVTNDAISFSNGGAAPILLNGQHRLRAIANTGIPAPAFVAFGLDPKAQEVMDTQARRSVADFLQLNGEPMPRTLAGAIAQLSQYRQKGEVGRTIGAIYPTTPQALALLNENPRLRDSLEYGARVKQHLRGYPPTIASALHYIFAEIDRDDADDFWHRVALGVDLKENDPIWHLRGAADQNSAPRTNGKGLGSYRLAALTIKAWNAYRKGAEIKRLRWSTGGSSAEAYPKPE